VFDSAVPKGSSKVDLRSSPLVGSTGDSTAFLNEKPSVNVAALDDENFPVKLYRFVTENFPVFDRSIETDGSFLCVIESDNVRSLDWENTTVSVNFLVSENFSVKVMKTVDPNSFETVKTLETFCWMKGLYFSVLEWPFVELNASVIENSFFAKLGWTD
jgi:hypothetical protein